MPLTAPLRGSPARAASTPLILGLACAGVFIAALDQTVVVTALPSIMLDIKLPFTKLDQATWIVTGYLLGYTVAMPLMGRLADVHGYVRLYLVALLLFAMGSVLVALSPSLSWLVASRLVQAVGGGATVPIGIALAATRLPAHRRGLAVALVAAVAEAGAVLGPLYGGWIIQLLDWRWIFWLNLPPVALMAAALWLVRGQRQQGGRMDYLGGLLLVAGLALLTLALSRRDLFTGDSFLPYLLGALGLLVLAALLALERRVAEPLLPLSFFRSLPLASANATQLLIGVAFIVALVTIPLMTDTVLGQPPLEGGLRLMRLTGAIPVGAVLGGLLVRRVGSRAVALPGLILIALAFHLMGRWALDVHEPGLTLPLVAGGLGFGLVIAPVFVAALNAVPRGYWGTVASLVTVARMMGMTLGLAALSAWGIGHFQELTAGLHLPLLQAGETSAEFQQRLVVYEQQVSQAGLTLFHNFFRVGALISLCALVPALGLSVLRLGRGRRSGAGDQIRQ